MMRTTEDRFSDALAALGRTILDMQAVENLLQGYTRAHQLPDMPDLLAALRATQAQSKGLSDRLAGLLAEAPIP